MKILSLQIINPDTNAPVSVEDWKKEANPSRAEWVIITTDELKPFKLHKKLEANGKYLTFNQAIGAKNKLTRAQAIAIYTAEKNGLHEILELLEGDPIQIPGREYEEEMVWTCEKCEDSPSPLAWYVVLSDGILGLDLKKDDKHRVRIVQTVDET